MLKPEYLTRIGIPFSVSPAVVLRLPEEDPSLLKAAAGALKGLASSTSAASADPKAKSSAAAQGAPAKDAASTEKKNFLEKWIEDDLAPGGRCHGKKPMFRFPPEPNGYLHIGHAKSILTNFGLAHKFGGQCNLRFDDTNPETEEVEYVESIKDDVCWIASALGMDACKNGGKPWRDSLFFASDYFDQMYEFALDMIKHGKAYVDSQSPEDVQKNRGGGPNNDPGIDSPFRNRSVEENLRLFQEMKDGKHAEGTLLLRAKIDMQSSNMNLRDPPMYRIKFAHHHNTKDKWKIYPIYDFAHGNGDAIEGVTHSICTLEFENHNVLYRWFIENCTIMPANPYQKEFARLEVEGAVTSKRKLLKLVKTKTVEGWDDPRLLTVRGIRRRGVLPSGIKRMCDAVGVTNSNSTQPWFLVEQCWRDDLEPISLRRSAVLEPLEVELSTYKGKEMIGGITDLPGQSPDDPKCSRSISMSGKIFIDKSDFVENAPEGYFRLSKIGSEVKLRYSYVIRLEEIIKDKKGNVVKLRCSHDPDTRDCMPADRKPKVIHWVDANNCIDADVRLINPLFLKMPDTMPEGKDFMDYVNPDAWVKCNAKVEEALLNCKQEDRFQFERVGYFAPDYDTFKGGKKKLVFNRVVPLKEDTAKKESEGKAGNSRKEEQAKQAAEKERVQKIPPADFFKQERGSEFSKYDKDGLPTHAADGSELPKSAVKKLQKDLEKHKKLHEAWKAKS